MKSRISAIVFFLVLVISVNLAAVPETINFQGALKDENGVPVNDTQFMEFRIYDFNNLLWSEQHLTVEIVDGIFSEELGLFSQFPPGLFDIPELFITFFYGGEEMTPWQKLHSVPYSLKAENTNLIQDVPLSELVQQDNGGNATITGTMSAGSFVGDGSGLTNIGSFDDLYVNTTGPDTVSANSIWSALTIANEGTGPALDITSGLTVNTAGTGISVNSTSGNAINVGNAFYDGVAVTNAGRCGFSVNNAGTPSDITPSGSNNGFEVLGAEGHGLYVGHADESGVWVENAENWGVMVTSSGLDGVWVNEAAMNGVYILNSGWHGVRVGYATLDGVNANTEQVSHEWGFYTPDKISGSNVSSRSQSTHVRYVGNEILESGDLVCIAGGYEENVLGEDDDLPIVHVTKANSSNSEAVLGVVEYKVYVREEIEELEEGKTEVQKSFRYSEGSISNGDYFSVIVFGPTDVNLESNSNIKTGEKLTVADNGYARNINDEDNWRIGILGKALEDSNGRGKIKVFVNCR